MDKKSRIKTTLDSLFTGGKPPAEENAPAPVNKPSPAKKPAGPKKKETTGTQPVKPVIEKPAVKKPVIPVEPIVETDHVKAIEVKPIAKTEIDAPSAGKPVVEAAKPVEPPAEVAESVVKMPEIPAETTPVTPLPTSATPVSVPAEKPTPSPVQEKKKMDEEKLVQLTQSIDQASQNVSQDEEHLVIFSLGKELYGVTIHAVESIIKLQAITQVPKTAAFILGVTNLRGTVVPVLDLRIRFNLPINEDTANTRIVIVNSEGSKVGIVVDEVTEVLKVARNTIQPPPPLSTTIESSFINGIARIDDRLVILLDLEKVLASSIRQHNR
jgi:purine-binding chemotaxis protein CheW